MASTECHFLTLRHRFGLWTTAILLTFFNIVFIFFTILLQATPVPQSPAAPAMKWTNKLASGRDVSKVCVVCSWDGIRPGHQMPPHQLQSMLRVIIRYKCKYWNHSMVQLVLNLKVNTRCRNCVVLR